MITDIIAPDDATLIEIAEQAAAASVQLVERGGRIALCNAASIPEGWHRMTVGGKRPAVQPC